MAVKERDEARKKKASKEAPTTITMYLGAISWQQAQIRVPIQRPLFVPPILNNNG
jgi:hypothetical protein